MELLSPSHPPAFATVSWSPSTLPHSVKAFALSARCLSWGSGIRHWHLLWYGVKATAGAWRRNCRSGASNSR